MSRPVAAQWAMEVASTTQKTEILLTGKLLMAAEIERHNLGLTPHQIIIRPLVTEKGVHKANRNNAYAFEVNRLADKDDIRHAVEELFDVKGTAVRTQNRKGKPRRTKDADERYQVLEEGHRHFG